MQSSRPTGSRQYYRLARQRPWPMVTWWYSALFAVPMLILLGMGVGSLISGGGDSSKVEMAITDSVTGQPLANAIIQVGDQQVTSDASGQVSFDRPDADTTVVVQAVNYEPVHGVVNKESGANQTVALRSTTVSGFVTDSSSGAPIANALVRVVTADGPTELQTATGSDGSYSFNNVPSGASIEVDAQGFTVLQQPVNEQNRVDVAAVIAPTEAPTEVAEIAATEAPTEEADRTVDTASLPKVPDVVRGIYISSSAAANPAVLNDLMDLIDRTELNAAVVDIKEDYVWYDTKVQFFQDAGAVQPIYDAEELIQTLHDRGIYVIARLVVFKDPLVAEAFPELAIQDDNGGLWRGYAGEAWVNPFNETLWDANIELAVEAAQLGFDEIQYDYVRFPSDGDLSTANFEHEYAMSDRVSAISGFLEKSQPMIHEAGAWLSADVFGIIALYDDDQGIGQYLRDLYQFVDFVSPMVYPSHFSEGSIAVDGDPNDFPGPVIEISMAASLDKMDGEAQKLRPWLQDFFDYTEADVRAQIDAAEASGASGWLLWNSGSGTNTEGALNPG